MIGDECCTVRIDDECCFATLIMSDLNDFSVVQLKNFLGARGLTTAGVKAELIARLMEADPSGEWMSEAAVDVCRGENGPCEDGENSRENLLCRREMEIYKREKEIAERELALARREIVLLREHRDAGPMDGDRPEDAIARGRNNVPASLHLRSNLTVVADLLADFDGSSDFNAWRRRVEFLRAAY